MPQTMQCFFSFRSMSCPLQIGHPPSPSGLRWAGRSVSSQMGAFFSTESIIPWYDFRMESSVLIMGPYSLKVERTTKGITRVRISDQSSIKTKNPSIKVDQLKQLEREPLDVEGTDFQKKVWRATSAIPYGETRTYADIAKAIGHPKAVRAVGTALGKNPVCVVVPCHRVVPSSGGIGNYAYGKAMKQWLLDHEAGRI